MNDKHKRGPQGADVATAALSAATEYVEKFCRQAGIATVDFEPDEVTVWNVARMGVRGKTFEDALRQFYRKKLGEPVE